jgi:hypothetical protein
MLGNNMNDEEGQEEGGRDMSFDSAKITNNDTEKALVSCM